MKRCVALPRALPESDFRPNSGSRKRSGFFVSCGVCSAASRSRSLPLSAVAVSFEGVFDAARCAYGVKSASGAGFWVSGSPSSCRTVFSSLSCKSAEWCRRMTHGSLCTALASFGPVSAKSSPASVRQSAVRSTQSPRQSALAAVLGGSGSVSASFHFLSTDESRDAQ